MTGSTRLATLRDDPETIRRRIRRYSLFLVLNRDAGTRRALEGLIRQAERQLAASMSTEGRINHRRELHAVPAYSSDALYRQISNACRQ